MMHHSKLMAFLQLPDKVRK